ncbi:MAG: FtsX-like permease family protein, partial [Candidatus Thermoplasmatota archaeon]
KVGNGVELFFSNPEFSLESIYYGNKKSIFHTNFTIGYIVKNENLGCFQLGTDANVANVFIKLKKAQDILGIGAKLNAILVSNKGDLREGVKLSAKARAVITEVLNHELGYKEADLKIEAFDDYVRVTSNQIFFPYRYYELLSNRNFSSSPILTYFVSSISAENGRNISYSTVAGFNPKLDEKFGYFIVDNKSITGELNETEIILNKWTAEKLNVGVGNNVTLKYMVLDRLFNIYNLFCNFTVKYVIELVGKANDRKLMPEFPGIEGIDECTDWKPPFPIDLNSITLADIEYWRDYRGTPKAFISLKKAQSMWGNDLGNITAIKLKATNINNEDLKKSVEVFLNSEIGCEECGISVAGIKQNLLESANPTLIQSMFLAFGLFCVIVGVLFVINIFAMLAEERKQELGILRALGMKRANLVRILLGEGMVYAVTATAFGTVLGLWAGNILILGLNKIWAVSIPLHYEIESLCLALAFGLLLATSIMLFACWQFSKVNVIDALRDLPRHPKPRTRFFAIGGIFLIILGLLGTLIPSSEPLPKLVSSCVSILGISLLMRLRFSSRASLSTAGICIFFYEILYFSSFCPEHSLEIYFSSGILLVLSLLLIVVFNLELIGKCLGAVLPAIKISILYPLKKRLRTGMTIAMFSFVIFLIVGLSIIIASQSGGIDKALSEQGGGYDIVGESTHPIHFDIRNATLREENGVIAPTLNKVNITPVKVIGQRGATCTNLNINLPPRILGVDHSFIVENRFKFAKPEESKRNSTKGWIALETTLPTGRIPVIGNYNTVVWLLGSDVGSVFEIIDEHGAVQKLEVVGLLDTPIFAGSFLMSEDNIDKLFPKSANFRYFLFNTNAEEDVETLANDLEIELETFGMDTVTIKELIKENVAVEQSYIRLFQAFLLLGLIIGLVGLGIVTNRAVTERKYEISVLRALGLKSNTILRMFLIESSYIALLGISIGALAGVVFSYITFGIWGVSYYVLVIPWYELITIILAIYGVSMICVIFPIVRASSIMPAEALRRVG